MIALKKLLVVEGFMEVGVGVDRHIRTPNGPALVIILKNPRPYNSYYSPPPRYQPMDYSYQNYHPAPHHNSGYRYTPNEPMPNMQAPSHDTMKKWYLQGMGDANKQHAEMVKKVNQVLDERTNPKMQEHDMDTDDEAYLVF